MYQVILDTVAIGDFLAQFFDRESANRGLGRFVAAGWITNELAGRLNHILDVYRSDTTGMESQSYSGSSVVLSSFAFVELVRKWHEIVDGRFGPLEFRGFLEQPPDWTIVDPLDEDLMPAFLDVPTHVRNGDGNWLSIEWTDAVHVATAISRGNNALLATSDARLALVDQLKDRVIRLSRS